jgi:hypothetical protein
MRWQQLRLRGRTHPHRSCAGTAITLNLPSYGPPMSIVGQACFCGLCNQICNPAGPSASKQRIDIRPEMNAHGFETDLLKDGKIQCLDLRAFRCFHDCDSEPPHCGLGIGHVGLHSVVLVAAVLQICVSSSNGSVPLPQRRSCHEMYDSMGIAKNGTSNSSVSPYNENFRSGGRQSARISIPKPWNPSVSTVGCFQALRSLAISVVETLHTCTELRNRRPLESSCGRELPFCSPC